MIRRELLSKQKVYWVGPCEKESNYTAADDMPTEYRKISKQNSNYFLNVREGNKQWIIYFAYNCIYQASLIES